MATSSHHQQLYRDTAQHVRGTFSGKAADAACYYERYARFVASHIPRGARVLDVGCGNGWSTWLLKNKGFDAVGTDLHEGPLEAHTIDPAIEYVAADAQSLPFAEGSFDAVAMHQVLEHVPSPARALAEAARVVRPGGRVVVVGPHLLSVGLGIKFALLQLVDILRGKANWRRTSKLPRHPFGNTVPEAFTSLLHHSWATATRLSMSRGPQFLMREPDPRPPFHADNDACYYCNPMDLLAWARASGNMKPVRWWSQDRRFSRVLWPFSGGTWFVAEKTER